MKCITCETELLASFKHAIATNQCPACGGSIMDEEAMATIEDVKRTIASEIAIREESAHKLAMALVVKYGINASGIESNYQISNSPSLSKRQNKILSPTAKLIKDSENKQDVISADSFQKEGISEEEREKMMVEAVNKKYNTVESIALPDDEFASKEALPEDSLFSEGANNPILEKLTKARKSQNQQALGGGGGLVRRK